MPPPARLAAQRRGEGPEIIQYTRRGKGKAAAHEHCGGRRSFRTRILTGEALWKNSLLKHTWCGRHGFGEKIHKNII
jgi:hypothetical protein